MSTRDPATYVPVHEGIWTSPKTVILARLLKKPAETVVGHLVRLWHAVQHHAPDGRLDGWAHQDVAELAGWKGRNRAAFTEALLTAGWLEVEDGVLCAHEWGEYGGRGVAERAAARSAATERKRRQRERERAEKAAEGVTVTPPVTPGHAAVTLGHGPKEEVEEEEKKRERALSRDGHTDVTRDTDRDSRRDTHSKPQQAATIGPPRTGSTAAGSGRRRFASRLPHEMDQWRETPEELLAAPDPRDGSRSFAEGLAADFPAYDGLRGRPTVLSLMQAKFPAFENKFFSHGPASAFPALIGWIGEGYGRKLFEWEKDGNVDVAALRRSIGGMVGAPMPSTGPRPRPVDDDDDDLVSA